MIKTPPPIPPKPPHEPSERPLPPHLHKPGHPMPPHERFKGETWKRLVASIAIGTIATVIFASLLFYVFQISINVVLPASAPIWVGTATIIFMALSEKK